MNESEEPKMKRAKQSENNEDRLSDLPDCVLIDLISFMPTKDAVQTCVLSRRWKHLWKRLPTLILRTSDLRLMTFFNKFVAKVLSFRDGSVPLHNLDFNRNGRVPPQLLKRVLTYALTPNLQQLKLTVSYDLDLPPCLFSCQALTSLNISIFRDDPQLFPRSINMPALTSLILYNFAFLANDNNLAEPFSSCIKLKTLAIKHCVIRGAQVLCISNVTLVNLTVRVYRGQAHRIVLSTPNLCSFAFSGYDVQQISASNLSFIKEVNIDAEYPAAVQSAYILISWLRLLASVRSLTLSSTTLQVLSSISDLLNTEAPCLANLKSLIVEVKIPLSVKKPWRLSESRRAELKSSLVPGRVVDYLISNSQFAEIKIIDWRRPLI